MLSLPKCARAAFAAWLILLNAACGGGHHHQDGPPVYPEQEPNDGADHPDRIGWIHENSRLIIEGHIQAAGPDVYDGFSFTAEEPCSIEFVLTAHDQPADLDLAVWDPVLGEFVLTFESPHNPEVGSFVVVAAETEFHLVVASFEGSSEYTLEVRGLAAQTRPEGAPEKIREAIERPEISASIPELDPRALFLKYEEVDKLPARTILPQGILFLEDAGGNLLEVIPVVLTAGGALIALGRSRARSR